jgi:hypothetical protein
MQEFHYYFYVAFTEVCRFYVVKASFTLINDVDATKAT